MTGRDTLKKSDGRTNEIVWKTCIVVKCSGLLIKYLDLLEGYLELCSEDYLKKSKIDFDDPECDPGDYFLYAIEYPNILRKSFLITCYSYLEHELYMTT